MMTRKIPPFSTAFVFFTPVCALAVGLGQIELRSALNQAFDAVIELRSIEESDLSDLSVNLASPQAFAQSSIERPALLSDLEFLVETGTDGRPYIRITSKQPIREPVLDFLVEVEWSKGRLVREFAVLLDPAPLVAVRAVRPRVPTRPRPSAPVAKRNVSSTPSPTMESPAEASGETYGPVVSGETLWAIAERFRPDQSISMWRMMQAIWKANPQAFARSNIDSLLAGATLRIPTFDEITGRPPSSGQARENHGGSRQTDSTLAKSEAVQVRLTSPEMTDEGPSVIDTGPGKAAGSDVAPAIPASSLITLNGNGRLQLKIAGIEDLRSRIDGLVGVDNAALTAIEERATDIQPQPGFTEIQPETIDAQSEPNFQEVVSDLKPGSVESVQEIESQEKVKTNVPESQAALSTATAEPEPAPSTAVKTKKTVFPKTQELGVIGALAALLKNPEVLLEDPLALLEDPVMMALVGSGLLALIALLVLPVMLIRRLRASEASVDEEEAEFVPVVPQRNATQDVDNLFARKEMAEVSETATIKPPQPMSNSLERVDLLIAVGNYKEAESTVHEALADDPTNIALVVKLLDIHFASGNAEGFLQEAEMICDNLKEAADLQWEHVVEMGRKICPNEALFGSVDSNTEKADTNNTGINLNKNQDVNPGLLKSSPLDTDVSNVLHSEKVQTPLSQAVQEDSFDAFLEGLDFDLQESENDPVPSKGSATSDDDLDASLRSLDFEFDDLPSQSSETEDGTDMPQNHDDNLLRAETEMEDDFDVSLQSLDLAFDDMMASPESPEDGELARSETGGVGAHSAGNEDFFSVDDVVDSSPEDQFNLEAELRNLDFDLEGEPNEKGDSRLENNSEDHFAIDSETIEDHILEKKGDVLDNDDFVETKLDLASAYLEMEDPVGAHGLLEEVLKEGSTKQKQRADELMRRVKALKA